MKFYQLLTLSIVLGLSSCKKKQAEYPLEINIDKQLSEILSSFCKTEDCSTCINEIFIDKIFPDSTIITIRRQGFMTEYAPQGYPLFKTQIDNNTFYIYTGAERFLLSESLLNSRSHKSTKKCSELIWTIFEQNGKYILKEKGGEPFLYFPIKLLPDSIIFLPPNGKVSN